jgi:hypothetical protein
LWAAISFLLPAANWAPFFRHRVYRDGPVYSNCEGPTDETNPVSVRDRSSHPTHPLTPPFPDRG